jgi:SAM-dependent methyltransferase
MPIDYRILASIHTYIHLGDFAQHMTSRLVDFAQRDHWMGRQIVDLGCGTGESLKWLAQRGYIVTGVDISSEMLDIARKTTQGMSVRWVRSDIRNVPDVKEMDLALALDVMHEFSSLQEIQEVFQSANTLLKAGKLFIFDLYTIEGLVDRSSGEDTLTYDQDGVTIFAHNHFDYERQIQRRDYIIFRQQENGWQRQDTHRTLRAYPIQGITALAQRCGFEVLHVLNQDLKPYNPGESTRRIVCLARKRA